MLKSRIKPVPLKKLNTYSIKDRKSKVAVADFGKPLRKGASFSEFLASLPSILAVNDLKEVAKIVVEANRKGRMVALGLGAHVIKVGLGPIIIDLMETGIVKAIAMNGAGIIHDFEIAYAGKTSEDVDAALGHGSFGMAKETGSLLNKAIKKGVLKRWGIGRSVGEMINSSKFPYKNMSIVATGARLGIPVTVHVAIGTDIIHMHPQMDPGATGEATHLDFRLFTGVVAILEEGVYFNVGSAVLLPEIFLKALTLARNQGHNIRNFTAVNMDFIQHYRPKTNVVNRPTKEGGKGYMLTGHHEIMLPLLTAMIKEAQLKTA